MSQLPPLMRDQRRIDDEHLKLLVIFHFIGAGFAVIGILFLLVHYAFFNTIMADPGMWHGQKGGPPPEKFFEIFRWFYLIFACWFASSAILNLMSAFYIRARRHRMFSLVVAGINCLHMPVGTILGAFTIVVLARDSVREEYEARAGAPVMSRIHRGDGGGE